MTLLAFDDRRIGNFDDNVLTLEGPESRSVTNGAVLNSDVELHDEEHANEAEQCVQLPPLRNQRAGHSPASLLVVGRCR